MIKIKYPNYISDKLRKDINSYLKEYVNCSEESNLMKAFVEDTRMKSVYTALLKKNKGRKKPGNLFFQQEFNKNPIALFLGNCIHAAMEAKRKSPIHFKEYKNILKKIGNSAAVIADNFKILQRAGIIQPTWINDILFFIFESSKSDKVFSSIFAGILVHLYGTDGFVNKEKIRLYKLGKKTPPAFAHKFTSISDSNETISKFNFKQSFPKLDIFFSTISFLAYAERKKNPKYAMGDKPSNKIKLNPERYFVRQVEHFTSEIFKRPLYEVITTITNIVFNKEYDCNNIRKILQKK